MSCKGGHAVVTGCSRGLGFAIAKRLVDEGFQVAVVCRRFADATNTAKKLGAHCVPVELDLALGAEAVRKAKLHIGGWLGSSKIIVLVNNAGNSHGIWSEQTWEDSRSVNYKGPVLFTEALLPMLGNGGSVTMVGSGLGSMDLLSPKFRRALQQAACFQDLDLIAERPIRCLDVACSWVGPYGLSKALLHRATEIFAADDRFIANSILVNAVCPGWVCTDMGGDQAPISVEEGAWHILETALRSKPGDTGKVLCYCYKNYDEEHARAWEEKHGCWEQDSGQSYHKIGAETAVSSSCINEKVDKRPGKWHMKGVRTATHKEGCSMKRTKNVG
eukprot:TRINITY_DN77697_c0_g1_i1.p1 TRINITY_DN77697_c0_g1~~TRINITY_DN77697_c0_g1_i1.p1  ORF type:complete len:331 (-),score=31.83 TRINITY_DN77697_c0_g1_i1:19-1011(-)